jgi:hypothetical protein
VRLQRFHFGVGRDPSSAILLAGTARSGTTWAAEMIGHEGGYRLVFEPFHPKVSLWQRHELQQYRPAACEDDVFRQIVAKILAGRVSDDWIDGRDDSYLDRRRIVKCINGNLLLGWLRQQFPETPVVMIIRHPCAVALSQLRILGAASDSDERVDALQRQHDRLMADAALHTDFLAPFKESVAAISNPFEQAIVAWCIQNLVPLRQLPSGTAHIAFYESLCQEPEREFTSLFAHLGRDFDAAILARVTTPSSTSFGQDGVASPGAAWHRPWRHKLSAAQLARAQEIAELFGLAQLYDADDRPNPDELARLRAAD